MTATGVIHLVTPDPKVGGQVTFHVESSSPDLFVHLKGFRDGGLVYEGWLRWFGKDLTFTLHSPAVDAANAPVEFKAMLEDWSQYSHHQKTSLVAELDFTAT